MKGGSGSLEWREATADSHASERPVEGFHDVMVSCRPQSTLGLHPHSLLLGPVQLLPSPHSLRAFHLLGALSLVPSLKDRTEGAKYMVALHRTGCALGLNTDVSFFLFPVGAGSVPP